MTRKECLDKAKECVCGKREQDYGSPEDNFATIAKLWTAYKDVNFTPNDVAMMMSLLKVARIKTGTVTEDSFVDLAGYAACGCEIETNKKKECERNLHMNSDSMSPGPVFFRVSTKDNTYVYRKNSFSDVAVEYILMDIVNTIGYVLAGETDGCILYGDYKGSVFVVSKFSDYAKGFVYTPNIRKIGWTSVYEVPPKDLSYASCQHPLFYIFKDITELIDKNREEEE